ncbi:Uncharacterised protein [[Clostridium] sordellii]|uniref:Uncharacterized protein n=1 Tax=Paraclostridium sordellii TaxID=1505 RepID=A0A0C7QTY9_PARSO|nr:hypothetical protein [Paeniclostridium sordellii]CEQ04102.1 Uncharacterised protein [[Clostridium] sordellii] [Paeniclostridium sordellii]
MLNYIVFVNKNKEVMILDVECNPKYSQEIGYQADPYWDWDTCNEDLQMDCEVNFDTNKAFDTIGIYKIYGFSTSCDTPDGYYEGYTVERVEKIQEVKY